ncbi:hypothetical protein ACFP3U_05000 [Kitasatospora misakiensis]|uniref:Uncharacterized protein n=1 Tax=Kitasatospora misakiensis TaxID=67330 RepID=A0ABW0WZN9_9ACTN
MEGREREPALDQWGAEDLEVGEQCAVEVDAAEQAPVALELGRSAGGVDGEGAVGAGLEVGGDGGLDADRVVEADADLGWRWRG